MGSWTYDHRIGLCVTLIAYLALMIVFVSSKIVVGRRTHQQGMYILSLIHIYLNGCDEVEKQVPQSPERDTLLEFIRTSKRGIIKPYESRCKEE